MFFFVFFVCLRSALRLYRFCKGSVLWVSKLFVGEQVRPATIGITRSNHNFKLSDYTMSIRFWIDPVVYNMLHEDPGNISYSAVGGLGYQIREFRESVGLLFMNPELFLRVGIKPPKGVLLYGPPGTGKTLLARAITNNIDANILKVYLE
ncbi:P-loop containing nucleoside triphosphate hydrolase protein [Raphanus sativus]|nr:P-loop containing nucleoside triphosphate hydrolase protein [Raphanus sativus]